MSEMDPNSSQPAAAARSRRWSVLLFFMCWTVLAGISVWWLISDAAKTGNIVIRVGLDESKTWDVRLRETVALARLNFPWAMAWTFLTPYVLWLGARFSFESDHWRSRLPILLVTGVGFVWASQWLSRELGGGAAMIVMVRHTVDGAVERIQAPADKFDDPSWRGLATNRFVTNRFTKVVVSSAAGYLTNEDSWKTTHEFMSGLTNLPHALVRGEAGYLPPPRPLRRGLGSAALDSFAYVALIGLAHAGVFYRRYREREQQASLLESRLNEARLRSLQAQLQPHFLFNALNGIATLLRRDPARAEEMLLSLSDLLRISLSSSHRQEVSLREELDFLGRYLAIQRMRFGERLQVSEEIEPATLDCLVPALLLQPLVENAIRHGFEPSSRPGKLRIAAVREGQSLRLTVEDNGVGLPSGEGNRAGVGLANVRERLATLHGDAQAFSLTEGAQGGVVVNIKLPARTEATATAKEDVAP
jgi:signal transduction histidine kinase